MRVFIFCWFIFTQSLDLLAQTLPTGCYYVKEKSDSTVLVSGKKDTLYVDTSAIITINDFEKMKLKKGDFGYILEVTLKKEGAKKFSEATTKWVQKKMAIIVSGEVISAPIVASAITDGKIWITGGMQQSKEEMNTMKTLLEAEMKKNKEKN